MARTGSGQGLNTEFCLFHKKKSHAGNRYIHPVGWLVKVTLSSTKRIEPEMERLRILRQRDVVAMLGISRSTLYDWMNPGSRRFNHFPAPIKIGMSAVGWKETDVVNWINSRPVSRRN
ncbi:helix-turn-helix transcriptional regulator [Laribacter hongkongensis]|nr:AlpA family phage regulatory protein [Laribacter hongkongensis]MCG9059959.1 AlpA family phage regulatory protein [Laribacter hongkongensis]MCG9068168.1 AlpA family phage regulatory protein [Laribacter hongkongensis]MCG9085578.1 AlpA family phage regulatory protein [Laribacter hongkongensis]MCG9097695.1 AlpA family phage regulatory protein [Laribacter hongkongensis]MCG9121904.1 AlpA family phage regulatory protein [Laribacter hongkongensis]